MTRRRTCDEDGTITVLAVGFTAVLLLAVAVVVDVSAVLLARRSAASAADGAAVAAAAQALDEQAFYAGGAAEQVPLSPAEVASVVASYNAAAARVQPGLVLVPAVEGGTAVVTATRTVELPFSGWLGQGAVQVTAVARARAPVAAP